MNELELLLEKNLNQNLSREENARAVNLILNSPYSGKCDACEDNGVTMYKGILCKGHALYALCTRK